MAEEIDEEGEIAYEPIPGVASRLRWGAKEWEPATLFWVEALDGAAVAVDPHPLALAQRHRHPGIPEIVASCLG